MTLLPFSIPSQYSGIFELRINLAHNRARRNITAKRNTVPSNNFLERYITLTSYMDVSDILIPDCSHLYISASDRIQIAYQPVKYRDGEAYVELPEAEDGVNWVTLNGFSVFSFPIGGLQLKTNGDSVEVHIVQVGDVEY